VTSFELSKRLAAKNILANGLSPDSMRMVTHYDVDRAGCERAIQVLRDVLGVSNKTIVA